MRVAFLACIASALPACFPTPSEKFACESNSDCQGDRVCDLGYCVVGQRPPDGGGGGSDAPSADAPPDADPFEAIKQMCIAAGYAVDAGSGGVYRAVATGTSWTNAQADCKDDVANATHLIVLSTPAEVTFMATKLGWIGLSDRAAEGVFVTVTGETGDQRPFGNGQPDNGGGDENCVEMISGGKLNDDQCGNNKRYVCECDGKTSAP